MKGRELYKWRKAQFLSQANLAELLGCHTNTIANWERGRTPMPRGVDLALETISQSRQRLVREMNAMRAEREARRQFKMAQQHPEHYLKLVENVRKARAARGAPFNQAEA